MKTSIVLSSKMGPCSKNMPSPLNTMNSANRNIAIEVTKMTARKRCEPVATPPGAPMAPH